MIWGWGAAQYPYLLPRSVTIEQGAGASDAIITVLAAFGVAVVVVLPALGLLFTLDQRSLLEEEVEANAAPRPLEDRAPKTETCRGGASPG